MYDKKFWNDIYRKGFLPWTDKNKDTLVVQKVIEDTKLTQSAKILDYGCGEGQIGKYFLQHGLNVDFADISTVQVETLRKELGHQSNVYAVTTPEDIPQKYDLIICSGVLHHIEPNKWPDFLKQFNNILEKGGTLWIAGFDEHDEVLKQNHGNAPATGQHCWPINDLIPMAKKLGFEVVSNQIECFKINAFDTSRTQRFICLKPKHDQISVKGKAPSLKFNKSADRVEYTSQRLQNLKDRRSNYAAKGKDKLAEKQKQMQQSLQENNLSIEDMGKTTYSPEKSLSEKSKKIATVQMSVYKRILQSEKEK